MRVVRPLEGKQQPRFVFEVLIWILVRYESCMLWVESPEATLNLILENEKLKLLINISCSCIYIWLHLFICRMTVIKERQYRSHRGRLSKSKSVNYFFKFVICFICYSLYKIYLYVILEVPVVLIFGIYATISNLICVTYTANLRITISKSLGNNQ